MPIENRTLGTGLQKDVLEAHYAATATGATLHAAIIPYPSVLKDVKVAAAGLSGSPTVALKILRFIVGTGVTTITGATTLTLGSIGTSGMQSMVLEASGSTLLNLLAGDVLTLTVGASNAAVTNISVAAVIQATQDIRTVFGA